MGDPHHTPERVPVFAQVTATRGMFLQVRGPHRTVSVTGYNRMM